MTFKIILTGVTGRIGGEVLNQCLKSPSVTSIIALSRRPIDGLPDDASTKLEVVLMEDFTQYSKEILDKLSGADGCIWCMSTPMPNSNLELVYPKAFAEAFSSTWAHSNKRIRYVHLTGKLAERDQDRSLWVLGGLRKLKGRGESQMVQFANNSNGMWETLVARPGQVIKRGAPLWEAVAAVFGSEWTIRSDELALALIDAAVNGSSDEILVPGALSERGQELIKKENKG